MNGQIDAYNTAMQHFKQTSIRVGVTIATVVALVAAVGAPFKWSLIIPWW